MKCKTEKSNTDALNAFRTFLGAYKRGAGMFRVQPTPQNLIMHRIG